MQLFVLILGMAVIRAEIMLCRTQYFHQVCENLADGNHVEEQRQVQTTVVFAFLNLIRNLYRKLCQIFYFITTPFHNQVQKWNSATVYFHVIPVLFVAIFLGSWYLRIFIRSINIFQATSSIRKKTKKSTIPGATKEGEKES